jgi:hypothetical protein
MTGMCKKVFQITVSVALVLVFFSSGVCTIVSTHTTNSACHNTKSQNLGNGITISGLCKIVPCSINKTRLFTLPDLPLRRLETESRSVQHYPSSVSILSDIAALPDNQLIKDLLKIPLSFNPPPIFYLNCTLIC